MKEAERNAIAGIVQTGFQSVIDALKAMPVEADAPPPVVDTAALDAANQTIAQLQGEKDVLASKLQMVKQAVADLTAALAAVG